MIDLTLFLAGVFLLTFLLGRLFEKVHIPWVFSSLIIGLGLAAYNPFKEITTSSSFQFLAQLGMYFILFIIGFEINLSEIRKREGFIIKTTTAIILSEAILGTFVVHYLFSVSWLVSSLVAFSFATIGEAVLLPILDEFNLTKSSFGQTILSIGVLDDIFEIVVIIFATATVGLAKGHARLSISLTIAVLVSLFAFAYFLTRWKHKANIMKFGGVESFFLFVLFFIFAFVGIGKFAGAAALGAILAGMALKNFIPQKRLKLVDSEIRTMAYGFFAPIFFLSVGLETDMGYLIHAPLLILIVVLVTLFAKMVPSYFIGRKELGSHSSIIMGIALTVKFSTSIVIIKLLMQNGIISSNLYSVLIGATVIFSILPVFVLSGLLRWWKFNYHSKKSLRANKS
ncbi:hypothetical protein COY27_04850 [Candidatus Woesearchaeota archaeon CG_4_10_14_0_2_um_filter_33_13]|nr:MAG: hypothetical protein COY27_04850 [Candidatus Woesearchaeota archaeon CG_4_10_14_0_2_um_filter_33_13]